MGEGRWRKACALILGRDPENQDHFVRLGVWQEGTLARRVKHGFDIRFANARAATVTTIDFLFLLLLVSDTCEPSMVELIDY